MQKIDRINKSLSAYFIKNSKLSEIMANPEKPELVQYSTFGKNRGDYLPLQMTFYTKSMNSRLQIVPYVYADRRKHLAHWILKRAKSEGQIDSQRLLSNPR